MTIEQARQDVKKFIRIKEEQESTRRQIEQLQAIKNKLGNDKSLTNKINSVKSIIDKKSLKDKIFFESMESAFQSLNDDEIKLLFIMHGSVSLSKEQLANQMYTSRSTLYRKENKALSKLDSNLSVIRELWN